MAVLAIATELQAFRAAADPGTPPDVQHYTFPQINAYARAGQIQHHSREFSEKGFEWIRTTMHTDGKLYIDGWKIRPRKEAPFKVLPGIEAMGAAAKPVPVAHFHDTPILSVSLLKRVRIAESEGMSHDDIIAMIEAEQGEQP